QLKILAGKGYLGSHGHNHLPLGTLSNKEKENEIHNSQGLISKLFGQKSIAFSYPYGSKASVDGCGSLLEKNGFIFSFTMLRAINHNLANPYFLSNIDNNYVPLDKAYKFSTNNFFEKHPKSQLMI